MKKAKRIISILLSLLMIAAIFLSVTAAETEPETETETVTQAETMTETEPESETETELITEPETELPTEAPAEPEKEQNNGGNGDEVLGKENIVTAPDGKLPDSLMMLNSPSARASGTVTRQWFSDYTYEMGYSVPEPWRGLYGEWEALFVDGEIAYCVEKGVSVGAGQSYTSSTTWDKITNDAVKYELIQACLVYGYNGSTKYGGTWRQEYMATQAIIQIVATGFYGSSSETAIIDRYLKASPIAKEIYYKIREQVSTHYTLPSFTTSNKYTPPTYTMTYNSGTGQYSISLTDTNNVLRFYRVNITGGSASVSGNTLTITTSNPKGVSINLVRIGNTYLPTIFSYPPLYWTRSGKQTVITCDTGRMGDPVYGYLKVTAPSGNITVKKSSEDGALEGFTFRVSGNGVNRTGKTDASGTVTFVNLPVGTYAVEEIETPSWYDQPMAQAATVTDGGTVTLNFYNDNKWGYIKIYKLDGEKELMLPGAVFEVYKDGELVTTLTTDENGEAQSELLIGGEYTVKEIKAPEGYVIDPLEYGVTINEENGVFEVWADNSVQRGGLKIIKVFEDGREITFEGVGFRIQGKATAGDLYNIDKVYYTDANGEIDIAGLPVGEYLITELEGEVNEPYILAPDRVIEIEYNNVAELEVYNQLKKGWIELYKTSSLTGKPLGDGAVYGIYNAETDELVESLTLDENGYAKSGLLIWGSYYIQEIQPAAGYYLDETKYPVDITTEGAVEVCRVVNEPKIGSVSFDYDSDDRPTPDTGDSSNIRAITTAFMVSGVLLIVMLNILNRRLRKKLEDKD